MDVPGYLASALIFLTISNAFSAEHYVDPQFGGRMRDGSRERPWTALQEGLAASAAGDTVYLRSGSYGILTIDGRHNQAVVTVAAEPGHEPKLAGIAIRASSGWRLKGLFVGPAFSSEKPSANINVPIVRIGDGSHAIAVENSVVMSALDVSAWTRDDWVGKARIGIHAQGSGITVKNNLLKNISHGLVVEASNSRVENNIIENFSGDGIRGLGDHTVYRHNTIKNCYQVDLNHDDGFQSWSRGPDGTPGTGEIVGVVLSGNRIVNYEDPNQRFRCALQGIGLFDGLFVDWSIENNLVVTDHWHGITVMGATNVRIINNTVVDPNNVSPGPPWITITRHKDGRLPEDSLIANDLAASFNQQLFRKSFPATAAEVVLDHNMIIVDPERLFQDASHHDFRPRGGSAAIDAGSTGFAPAEDIDGIKRPVGSGIDIGAHESR